MTLDDDRWRFVVPVVARESFFDWQTHLNNSAAVKLLENARIYYITDGLGDDVRVRIADESVMAVRELHVVYESEGMPHEQFVCAVRAASRTAKAFTLDQELREAETGRVIVRATVVMLMVDPKTGRVVDIPDWFWDPVERLEGRVIPVAPRDRSATTPS